MWLHDAALSTAARPKTAHIWPVSGDAEHGEPVRLHEHVVDVVGQKAVDEHQDESHTHHPGHGDEHLQATHRNISLWYRWVPFFSKKVRPSKFLSNKLNFRLSSQISIAEIENEFVRDFELRGNSDYPYCDKVEPTCIDNNPWLQSQQGSTFHQQTCWPNGEVSKNTNLCLNPRVYKSKFVKAASSIEQRNTQVEMLLSRHRAIARTEKFKGEGHKLFWVFKEI